MLGAIVNALAVIIGAGVGMLLKKGIPDRVSDTIMKGLALCVIMIGIQGMLKGENTLITILSVVLGGILGELLRIDDGMNRLGKYVESKFKGGGENSKIAEGFVTASLLFVVGAMAVVGSLQSGLMHDHTTAYAKSMLDGVSSIIFASTLGIGVMLSSVAVLVYQGAITLFAGFLAPVLSDTVIAEMTAAGSVIILGLGFNMIGLTKIKVANYLPAIFLPILFCLFI
ncbi:MAG: DUF554 domain-containing protein [Clostridia bacterium]|nr:DUF554 domain-containing protein [Clostridia bacterium]